MITDAQDDEQGDEKNKERDDFAQKMRDRGSLALLEIKIPDVAIDQCDHERGAQKNGGRADVIAPTSVYAIGGQGSVEGERKGEELI